MSLFKELKRRNVFRVAIAYLIIAWLVMQVADLVLDNIGSPPWVIQTLFFLLALGFLAAVTVSWAYEITEDGIKKESEVDRSKSITHQTAKKLDIVTLFAVVILFSMIIYERLNPAIYISNQVKNTSAVEAKQASEQENSEPNLTSEEGSQLKPKVADAQSIAVLPFVNMSADNENEYFSDGLSEELLNLLAKVNGLKVAARTSSFKFKSSNSDIVEIGSALGVAHVLEGSVRKSDNKVRITAQLIKVEDGFHLWSETYDRELKNIFEVQDEIAAAIVEALKLPLLGRDAQPLITNKSENFEAYDLYLQGRHHAYAYNKKGFEEAIESFKQAIDIDSKYAPAHAGLADSYILLSDFSDMPKHEAINIAREAIQKALLLDPQSAVAHSSQASLFQTLGHYLEAEKHLKKALQINPNYPSALVAYSDLFEEWALHYEALEQAKEALKLDPLSTPAHRQYTGALIEGQQYRAGLEQIVLMLQESPSNPLPYEIWGNLYSAQGLPQRAIEMYSKAHKLRPDDIYMASQNSLSALQLNSQDLATYWLKEAEARGTDGQWTYVAKTRFLFATGDAKGLLNTVNNELIKEAKDISSLRYKGIALAQLGEYQLAEKALQKILTIKGYDSEAPLYYDQSSALIQLLNVKKVSGGEVSESAIKKLNTLAHQYLKNSPLDKDAYILKANIATFNNNLEEAIAYIEKAIGYGYLNHWELINDPVYKQWADNSQWNALYKSMLDKASLQLKEYDFNNPEFKLQK